jgi:glutamate carboxypeptidase
MMKRNAIAGLLVSTFATTPAFAASLTAEESKIVTSVTAHHDENVALLEQLVNINSGTFNFAGVRKVGDILRAKLDALGMVTRWVPMDEAGRAGHLIAEHKGDGHGQRALMIGHLDTVFEPSSPFQKWVRTGDSAEGPGSNDMKGGDIVILSALRALKESGALDRIDVTAIFSGDEERVGEPVAIARRDMVLAAKQSDYALDFETQGREDGHDKIDISRRSSGNWKLIVSAKSGHSGGVGRSGGFGANYELARIVDEFRRELPEPNLTYNVSLIAGGMATTQDKMGTAVTAEGKDNIIAGSAIAFGDLRTLSNDQTTRVQQKMREIVARHLDGATAEITFDDLYPAMAPTKASQKLG